MTKTETKSVNVFGDEIEIHYDGNMWVSPVSGEQHATEGEAMRAELEAYYTASGDDTDDPDVAAEINGFISQMSEAG